jgi:TetR/AcrR family transcriptional regulator, copper-responsive repressor
MSGKPQYDENAVITAAISVFWRHGYANASISDLMDATGLSRSSLYQRFGDKAGLFKESLERYIDRVLTRMRATRAESSKASIVALLREFLPNDAGVSHPTGCLLSRSNTEQIDLTPEGKAIANAGACEQRQIILDILTQGRLAGEIEHHVDLDVLAWYYFGILQAIVSFPAVGATHQTLAQLIDIAMLAWPKTAEVETSSTDI